MGYQAVLCPLVKHLDIEEHVIFLNHGAVRISSRGSNCIFKVFSLSRVKKCTASNVENLGGKDGNARISL